MRGHASAYHQTWLSGLPILLPCFTAESQSADCRMQLLLPLLQLPATLPPSTALSLPGTWGRRQLPTTCGWASSGSSCR